MSDGNRPVAGPNSNDRFRDRVHSSQHWLWDNVQRRLSGSFSVIVKVEHSLGMLFSYAVLGGLFAYYMH